MTCAARTRFSGVRSNDERGCAWTGGRSKSVSHLAGNSCLSAGACGIVEWTGVAAAATLQSGWSSKGTLGMGFYADVPCGIRVDILILGPSGTTAVLTMGREEPVTHGSRWSNFQGSPYCLSLPPADRPAHAKGDVIVVSLGAGVIVPTDAHGIPSKLHPNHRIIHDIKSLMFLVCSYFLRQAHADPT